MNNLFSNISQLFHLLPWRLSARSGEVLTTVTAIVAALVMALYPADAAALSPDYYAESSRLSSGKWVKVKVEKTGIQLITAANLKKMGFADPSKVRVYGFGGRPLNQTLTASEPDDLPLIASHVTAKGLYFFGYDNIRWTASQTNRQIPFTHTIHPYAEESWYFLRNSDDSPVRLDAAPSTANPAGLPEVTTFCQPLLHEVDMFHPSTTGSRYLGEDFRSPTRRSFDFSLTDAVEGENCIINYGFGSNTTGTSTLSLSATGASGSQNFSEKLSAISDSEQFMSYTSTARTITAPGSNLHLEFSFQGSGTIKLARLDFIELQYQRHLRLNEGQLHFTISHVAPCKVSLSGAEASTIIWDVTDPSHHTLVSTEAGNGGTLTFTTPGGIREYVAFTPDKAGYGVSEYARVLNQDLHSLPVPDMLIIAPTGYKEAAELLAAHHRDYDGLSVHILTPEVIYNEFSSGVPDVTAFRRLMKMWYDRGLQSNPESDEPQASTLKYCLIMGEATYDHKMRMEATKNAAYPFVPIWQSLTGYSGTTSYSTDDYIGMLADSPTFEIGQEKIHVAVGRMPFQSADESLVLTRKYIDYVTKPEVGEWRNRLMFVADDENQGDHLTQTEDMIRSLRATPSGNNFRYEKIYLDSYQREQSSLGPVYTKAKEKMMNLWNSGVSFINYIGHANPVGWTHENLLNWTDITSFSNRNLPFIYAATCEFGRFDADTRSGAEVLWAYPEAGIIGIITPNRTVWIDQNGKLTREMGKSLFKPGSDGRTPTVGEAMIEAKNNYPATAAGMKPNNTNKLRYILIGDPAMRMPIPAYKVVLTEFNGEEPAEVTPDNYPVVPSMTRIEIGGVINDPEGIIDEDFNGFVEIQLYDAEKTVETFGNGPTGVVSYYNDRKTLLYRGVAKAEKGKWNASVIVPSEIENNYSPAQFSFYAYTSDRKEANGEFSKFYVYGAGSQDEEDTQGPAIEFFALNREDFQPGQVVHSSPIAMARISDPSGINISDAGIGHSMMLTLDDNTYFNDINLYYSPNADDVTGGSIAYPLSEISPGKHTLKLTVWDNAKNSSTSTIDFEVAVAKTPEIYALTTDVNPAKDHVNFTLSTDRPKAKVDCRIEVFDLNGRKVWASESTVSTDLLAGITVPWNLCDASGIRVPRGIYLYRATVISPEGPQTSKSYKLAVTAP